MKIKGLVIGLMICSLCSAQETAVGLPALLQAPNGKKVRVFVQEADTRILQFNAPRSTTIMRAPVAKVEELTFILDEDLLEIEARFGRESGAEARDELESFLSVYTPYMVIKNNLYPLFFKLIELELLEGNYAQAGVYAAYLLDCSAHSDIQLKGQRYALLSALKAKNLNEARKHLEAADVPVAEQYFQAAHTLHKGEPEAAMQEVIEIIIEHANEVEWLAPTEFLAAEIYLELGMTNSARQTADQVATMYEGSEVAWAASVLEERLYNALNGMETGGK